MREISEAAGLPVVRPHGLRHAGITELAEYIAAAGLPQTEGMALSRHRKPETFARYIDRQGSKSKEIVAALAARIPRP
jgi:integrase